MKRQLASPKTRSRTRLAASLCRRFGFFDPRGKSQVFTCLKALRELEGRGYFQLPPQQLTIVSRWRPRRLAEPVPQPREVPATAREVRGLRLVLVQPDDDLAMRTWNELVAREHPQGEGRLVGRQLRYLVGSAHGWLGAIGLSASALRLEARDRWIGWDADQRRRHRDRVVSLSRFLMRPSVRRQNLASRVLGACWRRLAEDFETRYGYRPWLVETFVDGEHYPGTCFQAANWHKIGRTKGKATDSAACPRASRTSTSIRWWRTSASTWECHRNVVSTFALCGWMKARGQVSGRGRSSGRWSWETSGCASV
ncbi:MAG: Druantia anti-phage system protein DruA [Planctomycetota bacterium]